MARQTLPQGGGRHPDRGVPPPLTAQAQRHGIGLFAVNPAYTSVWGTSIGVRRIRTSPGTRRPPP
jgi:hypothetical protein